MKTLTMLFCLVITGVHAQQHSIAHVSVWAPKQEQEKLFEKGYQQHLQWHAANNDTWSWYGWHVISGERSGLFIDATFGHAWSDYGKPINPAGDAADNELHTHPFANFLKSYKLAFIPELSTADSTALKAKFLHLITITVADMEVARTLFTKLKTKYRNNQEAGYLVSRVVDGGHLNEWQLLAGHSSYASYAGYENFLEDINAIERSMKTNTVQSVKVETLRYLPEMSLFPKQ